MAKHVKEGRRKQARSLAQSADRHRLYEQAVQDAPLECRFIRRTFRALRGRPPRLLREDFCGTAAVCCAWVRHHVKNSAIGVDLDAEVLDWARQHNLARLEPDVRMRVQLLQADVCSVQTPAPADVILAMNFSYQVFKTRASLGSYFRQVHAGLGADGVFFLDAFGGYEAYQELREKTRHKRFDYIWEHARYNPINGDILCHIHFHFPDGSKLKRAFTYDWRLWSLPELQELLIEAGFARVTVYWEEVDEETGEGTGVYAPATVGSADPGWVCFIVAEK
ncbi:MAG: class I SAM-dependent methyltransferase [Pseudomonadota bacterium]